MDLSLPAALPFAFLLTTLATLMLFHRTAVSTANPSLQRIGWRLTIGLVVWLVLQSVVSAQGVYWKTPDAIPPRIALFGVFPAVIAIGFAFGTKLGRTWIDSLPLSGLTWIHVVRVAVELILWRLYVYRAIPELMTFEGRNFDIVAGLTAPVVAYGVGRQWFSSRMVLIWNLACLALLLNIVTLAVLSVQSPFQKFAFDQPNRAVLFFPFSLLPAFIVPVVLFSHLVAIRRLIQGIER